MSSGRAPDELLSQDEVDGESEIQVALVRKAEEYKPPEKKMQAFSGTGRTLAGEKLQIVRMKAGPIPIWLADSSPYTYVKTGNLPKVSLDPERVPQLPEELVIANNARS